MKLSHWLAVSLLSAASSVFAEPCKPIAGLEPLLRPGAVLLLGEIHGTAESPAFVLDVACHATRAGLPVVVGLEVSPSEHERVDRYLASDGTDADRDALLAGEHWRRGYQDGRASRAMLELIEGVRRLDGDETDVRVALFDASGARGGQHRDRGMAANLVRTIGDARGAMVIALTGNAHGRVTPGSRRSRDYEPMGYLVKRDSAAERVIALNAAHGGGSAWICGPDCGVVQIGGRHGEAEWKIEIDDATRPAGYAGWYHVGAITASPPAHPAHGGEKSLRDVPPPQSSATETTAPAAKPAASAADAKLADPRFEGGWQAYDFGSSYKTWDMRFEGLDFRAEAGPDDWYEGTITVRPDTEPAQIDFSIRECLCSFKGETSRGIYYWEGESIVVLAPRPGKPRPRAFKQSSGEMMRLIRPNGD